MIKKCLFIIFFSLVLLSCGLIYLSINLFFVIFKFQEKETNND
jgi:hypothetical protein